MKEQPETKTYKTRILVGLFVIFIIMSIAYIPLTYWTKFDFPSLPKPFNPPSTPDSSNTTNPSNPTNPSDSSNSSKPSRPLKQWDIQSSMIDRKAYGNAKEKSEPRMVENTFYFDVLLRSPGDYVIYDIEVANKGALDAVLEQIITSVDNKDNTKNAIRFIIAGIEKGDTLNSGESKRIKVKVEWDPSIQEEVSHAYSKLAVNFQFVQN